MTAFYDGKYDVLLSTAIVESGLDIPNANTLIVHRADMFGLAQLYQLRGRVGRSKTRAYAYFTTPDGQALTEGAEKRLKVLQSLDTLGCRLLARQPRPRHPRRRQPAGRGAVGPHPRGRLRALPVDAGGGGRRAEGRRPRRDAGAVEPADLARHLGADPGELRRRPAAPARPLPAPVDAGDSAPRSTRSPPSWWTASASCPRRSSICSTWWRSRGCAGRRACAGRRRPQGRGRRLPQERVRQSGGAGRVHAEVARRASRCSPTTSSSIKADWDLPAERLKGVRAFVAQLAAVAAKARKAA